MNAATETCRQCASRLTTTREQARGVCDDCGRTEITK
jgi:predicted RNA-binding Zn-ribbon protein involved in translation (DUF1610 family)